MKASELMVGDWVMPLKKLKGIPGKVVTIEGGTDICWIDSKYYSCLFLCSDFEGIPLTPEILEKNFKEFIPGLNLMYGLGGPYVASDEEGQWVFGLVRKEPSARYPLVKITYVHELQHALRLCGIEKEIML